MKRRMKRRRNELKGREMNRAENNKNLNYNENEEESNDNSDS